MTILINGKDAFDASINELQQAAYDLARRAHDTRIRSYADELEQQIKEAWAKYHAGTEREPDAHDLINEYCDGVCVYNLDIACTLFASGNSDYGYEGGLIEKHDDSHAVHYAIVQDVTEELRERGALGEPGPPSEGSDDESNDESSDEDEGEGEADTERAPARLDDETVVDTDGLACKTRAKI